MPFLTVQGAKNSFLTLEKVVWHTNTTSHGLCRKLWPKEKLVSRPWVEIIFSPSLHHFTPPHHGSQSWPHPVLPRSLRQLPLRAGLRQCPLWMGRQRLLHTPEPPVGQRHPSPSRQRPTTWHLLQQLPALGAQRPPPVAAQTERLCPLPY